MIRIPVLPLPPPPGVELHPNCARCTALCCQYVSTEIDIPTTRRDVDNVRWYLMHPGVRVYVEDTGRWFIQFMSRCQNLGDDNLCRIYETRPQICRDLQPTSCEFALGSGDLHYFTTPEEFERWQGERVRRRDTRRAARRTAARRPAASHGPIKTVRRRHGAGKTVRRGHGAGKAVRRGNGAGR
ncbi:MAG TPA: YkgJ family cysteine cluster protein [Candidatus Krumholzibacteria bacterium]|nr:YkgJ family cysteine cluster protein [Candidatus Krumholzibacteria bacterium]